MLRNMRIALKLDKEEYRMINEASLHLMFPVAHSSVSCELNYSRKLQWWPEIVEFEEFEAMNLRRNIRLLTESAAMR